MRNTTVRLPETLEARLQKAAEKSNTIPSDIIRAALDEFLEANKTRDAILDRMIEARKRGL